MALAEVGKAPANLDLFTGSGIPEMRECLSLLVMFTVSLSYILLSLTGYLQMVGGNRDSLV